MIPTGSCFIDALAVGADFECAYGPSRRRTARGGRRPALAQVLHQVAALAEGGGDLGSRVDVLRPEPFTEAMVDGGRTVLTGQSTPEGVAASPQAAAQR